MKSIISNILLLYSFILIARLLSSWFPPPSPGPMRTIYNLLYDVTEPVLRLVRGLIPPRSHGDDGARPVADPGLHRDHGHPAALR